MKPPHLLLYCRAGFEKECAQEISAIAAEMGVEGFVKAKPDSGFAVFHAHQDAMGVELGAHVDFSRLVFPRQLVRTGELLTDLPENDRVTPVVKAARALGTSFAALWIEMPDTNDGKALATLTKPLAVHLERALRKAGVAFDEAEAPERLHVFFVGGRFHCDGQQGAPGQPRLASLFGEVFREGDRKRLHQRSPNREDRKSVV